MPSLAATGPFSSLFLSLYLFCGNTLRKYDLTQTTTYIGSHIVSARRCWLCGCSLFLVILGDLDVDVVDPVDLVIAAAAVVVLDVFIVCCCC